jgi:exonuclease SbcC
MRPIRLEVEGFTSFRERTVVDFSDAELFVLCGPTGSGKSSLIDAITFALYGRVPRYQDDRLVHPAISQGRNEARVRLDFALGGSEFTAVRVVRKQKRGESFGAVVKELRLESGSEVLAARKSEFDAEVKRLLGLDFAQFTTCVVLPQGDFARFLHATGKERQDLLKELMRLQVYAQMASAARQRAQAATHEVARADATLAEVGYATRSRLEDETRHGRRVARVAQQVGNAQEDLAQWAQRADASAKQAEAVALAARKLAALKLPVGVGELHSRTQQTNEGLAEAKASLDAANQRLEQAEETRSELPDDAAPLRLQLRGHEELEAQRKVLEAARSADEQAAANEKSASESQQAAQQEATAARARVSKLKDAHRAHALAALLGPGDPCPVCHRELREHPEHAQPPGLAEAEQQQQRAERAQNDADATLRKAAGERGKRAEALKSAREQLRELEQVLADAPPPQSLQSQIAAIANTQRALDAARKQHKQAGQQAERAAQNREKLAAELRAARAKFGAARDELNAGTPAGTEDDPHWRPPAGDDDDLLGSWQALLRWAEQRAAELLDRAGEATADADEATRLRDEKLAELTAACEACEIVIPEGHSHAQAVAAAAATSEEKRVGVEQALERADAARQRRREAKTRADVASGLAKHLKVDGFERWLLKEAFTGLVEGASVRLAELSSGDYSFHLDDKSDFEIIDHRNADERRSARTLSGGETFLASLALALALAERVASLAADGAAPLESIFLDEGFGTLDPDTLDTVASCIEELGAQGRMVGLVTHVQELAERVPVQFRVSRGPSGSTVERVNR